MKCVTKIGLWSALAITFASTAVMAGPQTSTGGSGNGFDKRTGTPTIVACTNGATWHCGDNKLGSGNGFDCASIGIIESNAKIGADAGTIANQFAGVTAERVQACINANL